MQKPMIHWLLHSTGDSHVVFVTLSSRTFVSLPCSPSRPGADHHLKCFSRFSFTASKKTHFNRFTRCGGQITWNLIRVTPGGGEVSWYTLTRSVFSWLFCFLGGKDLEVSRRFNNRAERRDLEAPNTRQQIHQAPFGHKETIQKAKEMQRLKRLQPVISPDLLLTTWLISTTSPEQRDEHQAILLRTTTEQKHKYKSKKKV